MFRCLSDLPNPYIRVNNFNMFEVNGEVSALTDGLLALSYLFGLEGDALISGVIASDATRANSAEIEAHIQS